MEGAAELSGLRFADALWASGGQAGARILLEVDGLARWIRHRAALRDDPLAPARAADAWLARRFDRPDDTLRRAAVAAMAMNLIRRSTPGFPAEGAGYPAALDALLCRLGRPGAYEPKAFASDAGLVCGLHAPVAPFKVSIPAPFQGEAVRLRLRKAAGLGLRLAFDYGLGAAAAGAWRTGLSGWAELHLDLRACHAFHPQGFADAYRAVAEMLRSRPDLAGVRASSWLYDPALAGISPELAFVRRSASDGGARFVPVRTDPEQRAFAAARSPHRRQLIQTGAYRPSCHMMNWLARDLIAWAERTPHERVSSESLCGFADRTRASL